MKSTFVCGQENTVPMLPVIVFVMFEDGAGVSGPRVVVLVAIVVSLAVSIGAVAAVVAGVAVAIVVLVVVVIFRMGVIVVASVLEHRRHTDWTGDLPRYLAEDPTTNIKLPSG